MFFFYLYSMIVALIKDEANWLQEAAGRTMKHGGNTWASGSLDEKRMCPSQENIEDSVDMIVHWVTYTRDEGWTVYEWHRFRELGALGDGGRAFEMERTEHSGSDVLSRYSIGTMDKIHLHLYKDFPCTYVSPRKKLISWGFVLPLSWGPLSMPRFILSDKN